MIAQTDGVTSNGFCFRRIISINKYQTILPCKFTKMATLLIYINAYLHFLSFFIQTILYLEKNVRFQILYHLNNLLTRIPCNFTYEAAWVRQQSCLISYMHGWIACTWHNNLWKWNKNFAVNLLIKLSKKITKRSKG